MTGASSDRGAWLAAQFAGDAVMEGGGIDSKAGIEAVSAVQTGNGSKEAMAMAAAAYMSLVGKTKETAMNIFRCLDEDHSGTLETSELDIVVRPAERDEMISVLDNDGDNEVSTEEWH